MELARKLVVTADEYLDAERAADTKHELVNGEIIAMAGGSLLHNAVCANFIAALGARLRGKPCRPLTSDQRVHVPTTGLYCYPDITVVCGRPERHPKDSSTVLNPTVVVEILSEHTRGYDRGEKASHYRNHPSLAELVLVDPDARQADHYRRIEPRKWVVSQLDESDTLSLQSLGIEVPIAELFEGTDALRDVV